jgi:hypothetical protein
MRRSGLASAILLLAGAACADDVDNLLDPLGQSGYTERGYYGYPGYGALGYLDPGYAFVLATGYGNPLYDAGGNDWRGNDGAGDTYPGYGRSGYENSGYGYGPDSRGYYASSYSDPGASRAADQRHIRQLEERIRKLEQASQQPLPPYREASSQTTFTFPASKSTYEAPTADNEGESVYQWPGSRPAGHTEYPTYQPSYGSPPTYQFRQ